VGALATADPRRPNGRLSRHGVAAILDRMGSFAAALYDALLSAGVAADRARVVADILDWNRFHERDRNKIRSEMRHSMR